MLREFLPAAPPPSVRGSEKLAVLHAVSQGLAASRGDLSRRLGTRPTTISELVAELLESRILAEGVGPKGGRGRPPSVLVANPNRFVVPVLHISSQSLAGSLINLSGRVVAGHAMEVPADSDNAAMAAALRSLAEGLLARNTSGGEVVGMAFSLSGLLDVPDSRWLFSSRWPRIRNLDVARALRDLSVPPFMGRNLDLELRARTMHDPGASGSTLLLHWGYGIGSAFASGAAVVNGSQGRFGEIGHWRVAGASDRPCRCGRKACLETLASLWALAPALARRWDDISTDEATFAGQASRLDLMAVPEMARAVQEMAIALGGLCRVLFPQRIVVTGPFVANAELWAAFVRAFQHEGILDGTAFPELVADQRSKEMELQGAAAPLFQAALLAALA